MSTSRATERVLSTLLAHHHEFLVFLERRVGTKCDAEDILQSAFVKMIEKDAGPRDEQRIVGWFYRVLKNALVDHYRRRDAERHATQTAARLEYGVTDSEADVELERVVCRCVTELLRTLKPEYADILETIELRDGTIAQAAASAAISPGTARVRLHRARRALRKRLERTCGTWARYGCPHCTCRVEA